MRLIMEYTVSDGCSYCYDVVTPIEYESEESFILDFESALDKAISAKKAHFYIVNSTYNVDDHTYYDSSILKKNLPNISKLDNWFELNKKIEV